MRVRARPVALALIAGLAVGGAHGLGAARDDCLVIEDFSASKVGEFPAGWKPRKESGLGVYSVLEERGLRFLRALSQGIGIQAAKQYEWNLDEYPVLAWAWRPWEFPHGADEKEGKNDSVLAVYLLVPHSRIAGPKAVKYTWSEHVPAGTRLAFNYGLTQVRVLESGTDRRGQWVEERVNARDDYLRFFEETETPRPVGIAVLTDSDDTESRARGDYASFRVCRQLPGGPSAPP